jgi:hypothetical protein
MQQPEIYQHPIKACIITGQVLSITLIEPNTGEYFLGNCHHSFGEVDAHWNCAQLSDCVGHVTGTARDIQD